MRLWKGEEGGPSTLKALSSIGLLICMDGDSMVCDVVECVVSWPGQGVTHQRDRLYVFDRLFQNYCCFGGERLDPA